MKKYQFLIFGLFLISYLSNAQTGIIKGRIIDQQSEMTLIGATISIDLENQTIGSTTDIDGYFTMKDIPVGRHNAFISYLGYESVTIPNLEVTTGKDVILNIELLEQINKLDEVVITAEVIKDEAQNEMAAISARQFGLEEVSRYAGGRSDIGRLAANFAGVSAPDDSRNDIVVRGNSPTGLLWQLEGIPIPNPNHYSTFGNTGGPVSAMNPNMLKNSDFLTSAFPAEYGNALGGVFDLGFRNGNKDRNEFMLQLGAFSGIEALAEGPVGNKNGSYLIAGRYSFVGIVGAGITSAVPDYKDLSFKVDFGKTKLGNFSLFGIGGTSQIDFIGDEVADDDLFALQDENSYVTGGFGVVGLKHNLIIGDNTYLRTVIAGSLRTNNFENERYFNKDLANQDLRTIIINNNRETTLSLSSYINSKVNRKTTIRAGALIQQIKMDNYFDTRADTPDLDGDGIRDWFTVYDLDEGFHMIQPFVQSKYRLTEKLSFNLGIHGQWSELNEQFTVEPRTALEFAVSTKHRFNIGFGIHNQNAPLPILFLNQGQAEEAIQPNRNLDFVRSMHYVIGHDYKVSKDWRIKTELYYQSIDRVPIDPYESTYSTLVEGADFVFQTDKVNLVNEGTANNRGIELTVEKFYSNGFHGLMTASVFSSKYTASDGVERSTPFNNGYVVNILGGKEFKFGASGRNAFVIDMKLTTSGGKYFTPVDLAASQREGIEILQEDQAFSQQYPAYGRMDLKFGVKLNSKNKRISNQFFLDFQNVTNRENIFVDQYNRETNSVQQLNQVGFFPDFLYRIQF